MSDIEIGTKVKVIEPAPKTAIVLGQGEPFPGIILNGLELENSTVFTAAIKTNLKTGKIHIDLVKKNIDLFKVIENAE